MGSGEEGFGHESLAFRLGGGVPSACGVSREFEFLYCVLRRRGSTRGRSCRLPRLRRVRPPVLSSSLPALMMLPRSDRPPSCQFPVLAPLLLFQTIVHSLLHPPHTVVPAIEISRLHRALSHPDRYPRLVENLSAQNRYPQARHVFPPEDLVPVER